MTVLVTGGAGFIGSTLVHELLTRGFDVRIVDDLSTGQRARLTDTPHSDRLEFVEGDVRDQRTITRSVADVDHVFHQAAAVSVPGSVDDPVHTTSVNCVGTANLLAAAVDADVETVVVASSSAVYGSGLPPVKHEGLPVEPESPYALSKYYTEQLAVQHGEHYDLDVVALRYFNVYGPRQSPEGEYAAVIPAFVHRMLDGRRPVVYGDGEQSRDFVFVEDVVAANLSAIERDVSCAVFNVASGTRTTINELVGSLNEVLGTDLEPAYGDPRPGDVRHSGADISRARRELGYEPGVELEEGLARTLTWVQNSL